MFRMLIRATIVVAVALVWDMPAHAADSAGANDRAHAGGITDTLERLKEKVLGNDPDREPDPVRAAQEALRDRGYDVGRIDGTMGPKTRAAVKDFQKSQGLKVTGRLDTDTMHLLRKGAKDGSGSALPREDQGGNPKKK